jgi:hypothetical protein
MQEAAFQGTAQTAGAFGLPGGGMSQQDITGGMPEPTTYAGGVRGYSSLPIYEQALEAFGEARPGQKQYIDSFFIDPFTGAAGSNMQAPVDYTVAPTPGDLGGIGAGGGDDPYFPSVAPPVTPSVTPPVVTPVAPGPVYGGVPTSPTEGAVFTSTDFSGEETPYTIVTPTDVRPPGYVDNTPSTFPEVREYYDSSPLNPSAPAVLKFDDGTSVDLGYDLGPSVAGGRGTIVPGQTTDIGLVSGGGADGVGNFGQVGDFLGGIGDALGITDYSGSGGGLLSSSSTPSPTAAPSPAPAPVTSIATLPTGTTLPTGSTVTNTYSGGFESRPSHSTDNQSNASQLREAAARAADLENLASVLDTKEKMQAYSNSESRNFDTVDIAAAQMKKGGTGIIYRNDRREVYVNGVMVGNPKSAESAQKILDRELKKKAEAAPAPPVPESGVSGSTGTEVRSLSDGTEYFVDSSGQFAGLKKDGPPQLTSTGMEVRSLPNGTEYFVDSNGQFAGLK